MKKIPYSNGLSVRNARRRLRTSGIDPAIQQMMLFIRSLVKPSDKQAPSSTSSERPDSGPGNDQSRKLQVNLSAIRVPVSACTPRIRVGRYSLLIPVDVRRLKHIRRRRQAPFLSEHEAARHQQGDQRKLPPKVTRDTQQRPVRYWRLNRTCGVRCSEARAGVQTR